MRVSAGDLLVRLDATQAQASLQMVSKQLDEVRARIARLIAERDGLAQPEIPAELAARSDDDNVKSLLTSEKSLFKARSNARQSQKDLLQSQIAQLERGDFGSRCPGRFQGEATGTDRGRTHRRPGPLRQAPGAADTAHDAAARGRANRRRTRAIDVLDRRDEIEDRRGPASDRPDRSGLSHRCRQGTRRDPGQGSRTGPSAASRRAISSTGSKSTRRRQA